jgi:uncharacterized protein (TIGR00730 family)
VDPVLGPDRRGVIVLAEVPRSELSDPLTQAGFPTITPVEAGLGLLARSAAGPSEPAALARYVAVAFRRPALARGRERWILGSPAGGVREGDDPVDLAWGSPLPPPRVAVFGGAWIEEREPEYEEIRRLGRWLAERGAHLVCGGYQGAMAAACQGVAEVGGTSVGITIAEWEDVVTVNEWLTHELVARDLFARLPVITDADAWVAFPGGVGTLQEVALCWNLVQTELARPRPLLLVGEAWDRQMRLFRELLRVSDPAHFDLVRPVASYDDVVEALAPVVERS